MSSTPDAASTATACVSTAGAAAAGAAHCLSSTCGISQLARNASSAIGTAMRNTVWIDSAYPATKPACTAAGRWLSAAGVTSDALKPAGRLSPSMWLARLPSSTFEKSAPKIIT
jgi:hypothetical protein